MNIKRIEKEHRKLTSIFNSGNSVLDKFIKSDNAFDSAQGITYVWLNSEGSELIGYYNISAGTFDWIDNKCRIKQCGAAHINYFAVTEKYQGVHYKEGDDDYKLSDLLLSDCLSRIETIRESIGVGCITLSSTEQGYNLYRRADFEELEDDICFSDTSDEKKTIDMYLLLE